MKKNSVDKSKSEPLDKEIREKYRAMVNTCEHTKEYFKKLIVDREFLDNHHRAVVKHYEDKLKNLEVPGKGPTDPDIYRKHGLEEIAQDVEFALAMISDGNREIIYAKEIIKISRESALVYERRAEKYKQLLLIKKGRK